jgi:hypothetical protein
MPTTRRNSIYYPSIAKQYIDDIKVIRSLLRKKRNEYKLAENRNDITEMNKKKVEFDEIWQTRWPYYNGMDRVSYSSSAKPYPTDGVLSKTNARARWQMIATALLARRGVDKRRPFEGLVPKINGAIEKDEFKWAIRKYINPNRYEHPPSYPRGSSEEGEEWEEYEDSDVRRRQAEEQLVNPFPGQRPRYRNRPERPYADIAPEGSPGLVTEGTAPKYSSPDYPLEHGGRKTRKHKRSKHKRSKHKRSKHKRSK